MNPLLRLLARSARMRRLRCRPWPAPLSDYAPSSARPALADPGRLPTTYRLRGSAAWEECSPTRAPYTQTLHVDRSAQAACVAQEGGISCFPTVCGPLPVASCSAPAQAAKASLP